MSLAENHSDTFKKYIDDTVRDFPWLEGKLVIVDASSAISEGHIDLKKAGFSSNEEFIAHLYEAGESANKAQSSFMRYDSRHGIYIICIKNPSRVTNSPDQDLMKVLDHELGHIVVKDAYNGGETLSDNNFRECAADVFACLKNLQRLGVESDMIDKLAWRRAVNFVFFGDDKHFTSFALESIKPLRDKIDFKEMAPQQMADLSWSIASEFSMNKELADGLNSSLNPIRAMITKDSNLEGALKALADFTCADGISYHDFKTGLIVLKPYLETGKNSEGVAISLDGAEWGSIRKKLKEKEFRMEAGKLLFTMPVISPATPRNSDVSTQQVNGSLPRL